MRRICNPSVRDFNIVLSYDSSELLFEAIPQSQIWVGLENEFMLL